MFLQAKNVLVVAAHPDDEMLGCGGTLARLRSAGARVCVLLLGEGPTSRGSTDNDEARNGASFSAKAAAAALAIEDIRFASLPDNRFDSLPLLEIIKRIEAVGQEVQPDLIFTHHAGDLNIDHSVANRAVMTAFRPLPGEPSRTVLGFEVLSSTEYSPPGLGAPFQPTLYVDIATYLERKLQALEAYASEMRPWPHPRSYKTVEHLARLRGSQCGCEAAEAFVLLRATF